MSVLTDKATCPNCKNQNITELHVTGDSKKKSLLESTADIVIGFVMYLPVNFLVLPMFAEQIANYEMMGFLQISAIFTAIALVRKFAIRRWFEKMRFGRC